MHTRFLLPSLLAAALSMPSAALAQAKGGARSAHPKVDAAESCEGCHAEATPGAFREWKESRHGIDLVKCFVCHGSTGTDFKRKPATDRCTGCHAEQVASMRGPAMKGKDCFTCHSAHSLNPHATSPAASTAAKLGADKLAPMVSVEGRIPPPTAAAPAAPAASPTPAGPGAEKDVKQSQPHPPTDR